MLLQVPSAVKEGVMLFFQKIVRRDALPPEVEINGVFEHAAPVVVDAHGVFKGRVDDVKLARVDGLRPRRTVPNIRPEKHKSLLHVRNIIEHGVL